MGRNGPSQWKVWNDLGLQILSESRQRSFSQLWKEALAVLPDIGQNSRGGGSRETGATVAAVKRLTCCSFSSSLNPLVSKKNIGCDFGITRGHSSFPTFCQYVFPAKSISPATLPSTRNAESSACSKLPWARQNGLRGMERLGAMFANSESSITLSWSNFPGVTVVHKCGFSRTISANTSYLGAGQPEIHTVDEESTYVIFPSHNSALPIKSPRRGVSVANALLDPGNGMCRASKLLLDSSLPSLRTHRLGETSLMGLQSAEATAYLPAGETVDWQQQRLGKWKDYDPRIKRPHSSSHSDAEPDDIFIPVKAFYISRSVDLKSLAREPFLEVTSSRNNLIIRCADRPPHSPVTADNPEMACLGFLKERYMVTFQYGSVVFFNFGDLEEVESLDIVRKYCSDEFREARKDDYGVLVRPTLQEWSEGGHDRVMLRKLDIDNIRVISSILGQSIALDHYAKKVDEMVTTFSELNRGMEQTGTFTMTRKSLFQLVAAANTTLADVILRLGLLERSDAAWKDANYAQIWEYLRDDFELDERFESLDFKLNIIQHNVRFFLEILQNRKSDTLEWIIILLITGEICVSLYDILHTAGAI